MRIFGIESSRYVEVFKTPFLIYLGWTLIMSVASFVFEGLFNAMQILSFPLYVAIGLYAGVRLKKEGIDIWNAILGGGLFGIFIGLVDGIIGAILLVQNPVVAAPYEDIISKAVQESAGEYTREDVIGGIAMSMIIISPCVWAALMAFFAAIGSFLARYIKKADEKMDIELEEKPEPKKEEKHEEPARKRPPKRFRKRK